MYKIFYLFCYVHEDVETDDGSNLKSPNRSRRYIL